MNVNKKTMHLVWSAGIVICLTLSLFALLFASCAKPSGESEVPAPPTGDAAQTPGLTDPVEPTETPAPPTEPPAETEPSAQSTVRLGLTEDAGREYLDKIVFIGDSTTYGIGYYYSRGYTELCPSSQIWTPASGTLTLSRYNIDTIVYPETGEQIFISEAAARAKPEYMIITLGVNGVSFMDEEWFISSYTALVKEIQAASPDTKIILNSIYPVAASYSALADINNVKISAANTWVERVAESTGCRFLNTYELLIGSDGYLPESFHNGDGIHLNGETFELVMEYIRTHAYK